jgi:hypothetical protein
MTENTMPVNAGAAKVIDLSYNTEGQVTDIKERRIEQQPSNGSEFNGYRPLETLCEATVGDRKVRLPLRESFLTNPDAANILRSDIRLLAFSALNRMPRSFEGFTSFESSNKPEESYLRDAAIGVIPKAPSGTEAPRMKSGFEGSANIVNNLYRYIVPILGDWIRFDQIGKVRQVSQEMGLSARMTEEYEVYKYITTTTNYTRNSTTGDNDFGANTQTLTFSADGLRTALNIIGTAKDRKSGAYLGYSADTLICGPGLQVPVLQLLRSNMLERTGASEAIGTGTNNPFVGMVSRIIVTPWFDNSYAWALCDSRRSSFKFLTVEPFNVFEQTPNVTSESWLHLDTVEYLVKGYFGVGFVDDRAWFLSNSTTDATVS